MHVQLTTIRLSSYLKLPESITRGILACNIATQIVAVHLIVHYSGKYNKQYHYKIAGWMSYQLQINLKIGHLLDLQDTSGG